MKRLLYALVATLAALTVGCGGHSDKFVISGFIEGKPSTNVRVIYFTNGNIATGITVANEGKFTFEGVSADNALIVIYDNEYRLLGRTVARNGEDVDLRIVPANPAAITAKGNEIAERWSSFLKDNAEVADRREAVKAYVEAHRADPLAALLVMTEIDASGPDASMADSLMSLIDIEARANDITAGYCALLDRVSSATSSAPISAINYMALGGRQRVFMPRKAQRNLIAIVSHYRGRDSVITSLREIPKRKDLELIELSIDQDTMVWSRDARLDSTWWEHGWVGGTISGQALKRLGIPSIPYFIVTDSAGAQLWRGSSVSHAAQFVTKTDD